MGREKPQTLEFWRGSLPHWEVEDGIYFVTIHVAGAIPSDAARSIAAIPKELSSSTAKGLFVLQTRKFQEMERWLDRADPEGHLSKPDVADAVTEAIHYRTLGGVWRVIEYVIMPNHLHLLFEMGSGSLKESLESFKQRTGRAAARILGFSDRRVWQKEWFDHWVRSPEECEGIIDYIQQNPVKAGLVDDHRKWPYGSWQGYE